MELSPSPSPAIEQAWERYFNAKTALSTSREAWFAVSPVGQRQCEAYRAWRDKKQEFEMTKLLPLSSFRHWMELVAQEAMPKFAGTYWAAEIQDFAVKTESVNAKIAKIEEHLENVKKLLACVEMASNQPWPHGSEPELQVVDDGSILYQSYQFCLKLYIERAKEVGNVDPEVNEEQVIKLQKEKVELPKCLRE